MASIKGENDETNKKTCDCYGIYLGNTVSIHLKMIGSNVISGTNKITQRI